MKLILILLGLLLILLILRLFIVKEGFENQSLNDITIKKYNNFLTFYNSFCANWKKAIISSVASEIPQQPATDPANPTASGTPDISDSQMNNYITKLSNTLSKPLPSICISLPTTVNSSNIIEITGMIPLDVQPFINALNWMNPQIKKSQADLGSALKGNTTESFEDICQNVASCLENNPQFIQQVASEISEQNDQQIILEQEKLLAVINPFLKNSELSELYEENKLLFENAQKIQDQAQSGELENQINVPGGRTIAKYQMPDGSNKLINMKQDNPDRYNELKQNYSQWTSLKEMLDNINSNL